MEVKETKQNGYSIVTVSGRLDASTAPEAENALNQAVESTKKLIINLQDLEYISSAGLRTLLVTAKKIRHISGNLAVCCLQDSVKEVFDISGFSSIFSIYSTEQEAIDGLA